MDYQTLEYTFTHSPVLKLFRSEHASFIISFLIIQFKSRNRITIPYPEIHEKLSLYIDEINDIKHGEPITNKAEYYLDVWCDESHRFMRKYYQADSDEAMLELTPDAEKALVFIHDMEKREFVGTESRFLRIFDLVREIVQMSNEDPKERLDILNKQKKQIEKEINVIKEKGTVSLFNSTQIKERFHEATDTSYKLLSDFRQVEQNFKHFARDIQKKRLGENISKGSLLKYILDTDDDIKESDQGRSFYAFYHFLTSPQKQEELDILIEKLFMIGEIKNMSGANLFIKHIKHYLIDAGEKVISSNHRLSEQLRHMLNEKIILENMRVQNLIADIKKTAFELASDPPSDKNFFHIEDVVMLNNTLERTPWQEPQIPDFAFRALASSEEDIETINLADLFNQFYVNVEHLKKNINKALSNRSQISLAELISEFPINDGLAEIIAYCSIAAEDKKHILNNDIFEEIHVNIKNKPENIVTRRKKYKIPQIIFINNLR